MTVEAVRGSLDSTDNGTVKNSIRNCLTVFQNDPKLEGAIRYNILTERIDIVKPDEVFDYYEISESDLQEDTLSLIHI